MLLLTVGPSRVGQLSNYHSNAIYELGYNHEDVHLVYFVYVTFVRFVPKYRTSDIVVRFLLEMDSRKSGLVMKDGVLKNFGALYDKWRRPACMVKSSDTKFSTDNRPDAKLKRKVLGPFILETLREAGRLLKDELLLVLRQRAPHFFAIDPDLDELYRVQWPYLTAQMNLGEDLTKIESWVDGARAKHGKASGQAAKARDVGGSSSRNLQRSETNARFVEVQQLYAEGPPDLSEAFKAAEAAKFIDVNLLKASYAVVKTGGAGTFAFRVAFQYLIQLKEKADLARPASVVRMFNDNMIVQPSVVRALKARRGDMDEI